MTKAEELLALREALRPTEEMVLAGADVLLAACESPNGNLHPWKPFDVAQIAIKVYRAMATSALAHPGSGDAEPGAWRTIETAPMDGTRVLLYQTGRGAFEGWWHTDWHKAEAWWMDDADSEPEPTHWQPLLATPQAPAQTLQHHTGDGE